MTQPAYLIDASIYIFRAYFSLPERWHSAEGYPLNAVYGYTAFLLDLLDRIPRPWTVAAAFDESLGSCFRNAIYPGYKASRELPDEALAFQLAACRELTERLGIPSFGGTTYEADDYLATLAAHFRAQSRPVVVITRDKDLGQLLLQSGDRLWDFAADTQMDRAGFVARFGVRPEEFADYQGLVGDSIDDIPGVPSVGPKTGAALIDAFGDLETLAPRRSDLSGLGLRGAARISAALESHWEQALMSRDLARLCPGVPGVTLSAALAELAVDTLTDYLETLGLAGPLRRRALRLQ
ncbi:MAG: 5'-3' exonuclease H3TH domain-containing protein [Pseudomonadota bacterium]